MLEESSLPLSPNAMYCSVPSRPHSVNVATGCGAEVFSVHVSSSRSWSRTQLSGGGVGVLDGLVVLFGGSMMLIFQPKLMWVAHYMKETWFLLMNQPLLYKLKLSCCINGASLSEPHMCLHAGLQLHLTEPSKDDWSCSCLLWRLSTKTGRWMHRNMV